MRTVRKYRNRPTIVHGRWFQSAAEADRYLQLYILGCSGLLSNLELQPTFPLVVNGLKVGAYRADFAYLTESGKRIIEDVKGVATPVYRLKSKLVKALYGITVQEVRL